MFPKKGSLLRIYISEKDKHGKTPLYKWIVNNAKQHKLAGATVLRGIEGFGASSRIHTAKILQLSFDQPVVIEIVDTPEKIKTFLDEIDSAIEDGLATIDSVDIHFYRSGKNK